MCAGERLTVTVTPDATVREILDLMHTRAVHRVWVVDDARRPTGVIALSDVLAAIAVEDAGAGETDTAKSMARSTGTTTTTAATSSPA
jgi:CBS domain-containing protein